MIQEIKSKYLNNIVPKVNKKEPPKSINPDLTALYFTALFIGAKNSGKTYGIIKLIKNYEDAPVRDSSGNNLPIRTILFCPTGNSEANPIYKTLNSLDFENDVILQYTENALLDKIDEIEQDKKDIEEYNKYCKAYKHYLKVDDMNKLEYDDIMLLYEKNFEDPENIQKPKYKFPPVVFMILDDLIGDNQTFKRNGIINNVTIKHRHLGINLLFTSQNPKSIPNIIRNNIDIFVLYKFANIKMIFEKVYEEVSNIITETEFEELYKHATKEPYNSFVIDTHPKTDINKRLKKNFDVVLTI